ncbi:hypothetical protein L1987_36973 [Smallanthus sonchifolius]|uniref:Uncharacterized protein n=1 Tax=Smallanthus sonchifolius TaxID=185202 RepID=A0ACB9HGC8_9ASTR|nr:hypothetical protein L1987_36973 [Smallanthus sonchifolius]
MGLWSLFEVASMPILELTSVGAVMATEFFDILSSTTRKLLNKIVFVAFTPSLIFSSLAKTVTLEDIISWWFMPVNIGNLGNILLIIVPAICTQSGSPFGEHSVCQSKGLSYSSFSMALGSLYIWIYTFQLLKSSSLRYTKLKETEDSPQEPNKASDANEKTQILNEETQEYIDVVIPLSYSTSDDTQIQPSLHQPLVSKDEKQEGSFSSKLKDILHKLLEELLAPPNLGSFDPIFTGLRKASIIPIIIITMIIVRYVILPVVGIMVVKAAGTMTQLFNVGQEECSVLTMWGYLAAAFALTGWSTVFMWILT